MVSFAAHDDGIGIWVSGSLVAVIPRSKLHELIYLAAKQLQGS